MAKKKTPEDVLYKKLQSLDPNKWYKCPTGEEGEKFVAMVKTFIDIGMPENFELSDDYKKVRRCYLGCRCPFTGTLFILPFGFTCERTNKENTVLNNGLICTSYTIKYKGKFFTSETYIGKNDRLN